MAHVQTVLAGRYELLDILGRGGMGVVYRARDRLLARTVAVKVLPVDRAVDPTMVARFEREALAAASLNHPNIVAIFDSGLDDDTHFIVMERVSGLSLAQLIRERGAIPPRHAVRIATPIASAIAAAHSAGIVHRDIKPANVMIDDAGAVKVLDFGIARAAASTSLTHTAAVIGSAPYLAPELTRGEPADPRSDIYSLGCVIYEMLTGRPPFTGELPAAVMQQHNAARPRPPRELNPDVPPALDRLVMRMLAKRRQDRPQEARLVAAELPSTLDGRTAVTKVLGRPTRPLAEPTRRLPGRRRLTVVRWVVVAAVLIAILLRGVPLLLDTVGATNHRRPPAKPTATTVTHAAHRKSTTVSAASTTTATVTVTSHSSAPAPQSTPAPGPQAPAGIPPGHAKGPHGHEGHGHGKGSGD